MLGQFLAWYVVVQLITLATLPLTLRLFTNLADCGYAFAKSLGILLVGLVLWLGTSYGLLRNENGGAWLAVVIVAGGSVAVGRRRWQTLWSGAVPLSRRYILVVELLFLLAFATWAFVRAHDPAANHTEKPMDLMFMNSIWVSPTYPPQDAWLSGYAISYYYFGYWLLVTVGRLAGQPPETAFSVGQACWFGLLLIGCVGVVYNLLRRGGRGVQSALAGGLLGAVAVGVTGNLQIVLEWLYARGVNVTWLANWLQVEGFPPGAPSGNWYIGMDWWWWRSSRVLEDLTLSGQHIEVIAEFPIFSYVLGDNHPHVLAMPFVLLVIGMAQNLFFAEPHPDPGITAAVTEPSTQLAASLLRRLREATTRLVSVIPLGWIGALLLVLATGALVFLNTWDFPPYWLLLVATIFAVVMRCGGFGSAIAVAAVAGVGLVAGAGVVYLPYFLTAQSQAGGIVPNFFNPTRLAQFLLMFGFGLCGVGALLGLAWSTLRPNRSQLVRSALVIYGGPLVFLLVSLALAFGTERGRELLNRMALPEGASSYLPYVAGRWAAQGWTFLLVGAMLSIAVALLWAQLAHRTPESRQQAHAAQATVFALLLAALGLLWVYAPEFVFLRDNFGSRMNTIFKFYYQAWLLFGLAASYAIVQVLSHRKRAAAWMQGLAVLSAIMIAAGLLFPAAAAYSKTNGFAVPEPTFDAIAYVGQENPAELAAIRWVIANTAPDALIVQSIGIPYRAQTARISAATGRPTLLGWEGHEGQWRGKAYGEMAQGRKEALDLIYRSGSTTQVAQVLAEWDIDYVYVGPTERAQYGMTPLAEERLQQVMDLVFEAGDVRIFQRRGQ